MGDDWHNIPFSPYTHVLNTNYSPTHQESEEIYILLEQSQANLERIQMQIKKLEEQLLKVQTFVAKHRALLAPIRRVPPDILGEIFFHSLPTDSLPTRCAHTSPILLSSICRSWRDVSFNTPRLWKAIHIQFPDIMQDFVDDRFQSLVERRLKGIKNWLSHSGSLPLSLSLYVTLDLQYLEDSLRIEGSAVIFRMLRPIEPILELLLSYFTRWEHITFQVPAALLRSLQRMDFSGQGRNGTFFSLNLLRSYITPSSNHRDSWDDHNSISNFIQIPSLKELSFHNEKINLLELPNWWPNLTHLAVTAPRYLFTMKATTALRILPRCGHSLVSLTLDLVIESHLFAFAGFPPPVGSQDDNEWPEEIIELPKLTNLIVRFDVKDMSSLNPAYTTTKRFFDALFAPSLEHLSTKIFHTLFQSDTAWNQMDIPFHSFLEGSACKLLSLDICMPVGDRKLGECLKGVGKELRVLNITGDHYYRLRGRVADFHLEVKTYLITEGLIQRLMGGQSTVKRGESASGFGSTVDGPIATERSGMSAGESADTWIVDEDVVCPNLEEMRLLIVDPERVFDLLALAEAKLNLNSQLETRRKFSLLQVDFRRAIPDPEQVSEQLARLRKKGMTVKWRSVRGRRSFEEDLATDGLETMKNDMMDVLLTDSHFPISY